MNLFKTILSLFAFFLLSAQACVVIDGTYTYATRQLVLSIKHDDVSVCAMRSTLINGVNTWFFCLPGRGAYITSDLLRFAYQGGGRSMSEAFVTREGILDGNGRIVGLDFGGRYFCTKPRAVS